MTTSDPGVNLEVPRVVVAPTCRRPAGHHLFPGLLATPLAAIHYFGGVVSVHVRRDPAWPRRFQLFRHRDISGVSGTGVVAFGTIYPSGLVTLCWLGEHPSVTTWSRLSDMLAIHGHDGATEIVWIDEPEPAEARATRTLEYAAS